MLRIPGTAYSTLHRSSRSIVHSFPFRTLSAATMPPISLTPQEDELVSLLNDCAAWIDSQEKVPKASPTELRIAGGWVRDKLLGIPCHDIDVSTAPEPLTGLTFATLFKTYLDEQGKTELMGRLAAIEARPEQSKHLETATATVCGLSVDWVQQRGSEKYSTESRIPEATFGTPLEDAERRDLTINALFYNLRTRSVEDFTGKGLSDLGFVPGAQRMIRTPLEPFSTFQDDPLRVLRAVRFASRFGRDFVIDSALQEAVHRPEIRASLRDGRKISRERVSVELEKMLSGPDPAYSLELIHSLDLHPLVFLYDHEAAVDSPLHTSTTPKYSLSVTASRIIHQLLSEPPLSLHPLLRLHTVPDPPPDTSPTDPLIHFPHALTDIYTTTSKRLYLLAGLLPLYDVYTLTKKKATVWVGESVVKTGIKWKNSDALWAVKAHSTYVSLSLPDLVYKYSQPATVPDPVELGLFLRHSDVHDQAGTRWNVSIVASLIVDLAKRGVSDIRSSDAQSIIEAYSSFVSAIESLGLHEYAFNAPLLNGKEVQQLIPQSKGTMAVPDILNLIISYQLKEGPNATKESCEAYLLGEAKGKVDEYVTRAYKPKGKGNK